MLDKLDPDHDGNITRRELKKRTLKKSATDGNLLNASKNKPSRASSASSMKNLLERTETPDFDELELGLEY